VVTPVGIIGPFGPAVTVIVYLLIADVAAVIWSVVTFVNMYVVTVPADTLFTDKGTPAAYDAPLYG
jgi:hypothetical protein